MSKKQARFRLAGRDLMAAALLGPGPALDAAVDQLTWFDTENGQSRISAADLRHLAQGLMRSAPDAVRLELLHILGLHSSATARSLCAVGLSHVWGQEGHLALVDKLSRDRSTQIQSHLAQSMMEMTPDQQQSLSLDWIDSPLASQRAIAARMCAQHPASQALAMLDTLASDEGSRVRQAVAESMLELADRHPREVRQTLQSWAKKLEKQKVWITTRVISRAPLNQDIPFVITVLERIADEIPADKDVHRRVISVLRALARQHGNHLIYEALSGWLQGDDATLADVATEALRRIE